MARIELHKVYPFKAGSTRMISESHYITIEMETAKSKASWQPFRIVWHVEDFTHEAYRASSITEACEKLPYYIKLMTEGHSDYSPKKELI